MPAPVSTAPKSPPMCSQLSSSSGPFAFAPSMTSWAVCPDGKAIGIISCVIGKDSLFWNRNSLTPAGRVVGTPWYLNC